eukprot:TRINITY_DN2484_c0_g1_i1.p1 TRINITY_DN2484_c0_g1~~TRINITY_DN2484_c0_g1_i1.p1  ORF type:complete len:122 (-),score=32.88 TRINITY_DN2484_c0_g1_i1:666-1031(-)
MGRTAVWVHTPGLNGTDMIVGTGGKCNSDKGGFHFSTNDASGFDEAAWDRYNVQCIGAMKKDDDVKADECGLENWIVKFTKAKKEKLKVEDGCECGQICNTIHWTFKVKKNGVEAPAFAIP